MTAVTATSMFSSTPAEQPKQPGTYTSLPRITASAQRRLTATSRPQAGDTSTACAPAPRTSSASGRPGTDVGAQPVSSSSSRATSATSARSVFTRTHVLRGGTASAAAAAANESAPSASQSRARASSYQATSGVMAARLPRYAHVLCHACSERRGAQGTRGVHHQSVAKTGLAARLRCPRAVPALLCDSATRAACAVPPAARG